MTRGARGDGEGLPHADVPLEGVAEVWGIGVHPGPFGGGGGGSLSNLAPDGGGGGADLSDALERGRGTPPSPPGRPAYAQPLSP